MFEVEDAVTTTILIWALAALLCTVGLAGLVLPALPGAPLLFAGLAAAAWAEDFVYIGPGTLIVLGVLAALAMAVDFIAGALGARRYGASGRAVAGAAIGGVVGLFFGIVGVVLGPFLGAVIGELSMRRDVGAAGRAGVGATLGFILGSAAKLAIGFTMIGIALVMRFLA
jgi:uncharacterized protein YqgC (DUF456 family)